MDLTQEVIARVQIQAAMHHYASLGRENMDFSEGAKLFEPDAIYRLPSGKEVPPSRMAEVVQGDEAKYIRHHITTIDIEFIDADTAKAEAYFFGATEYKFNDHWGRWKDVWRRQKDGKWLIKERTIIIEGQDPAGWTARVYGDSAVSDIQKE